MSHDTVNILKTKVNWSICIKRAYSHNSVNLSISYLLYQHHIKYRKYSHLGLTVSKSWHCFNQMFVTKGLLAIIWTSTLYVPNNETDRGRDWQTETVDRGRQSGTKNQTKRHYAMGTTSTGNIRYTILKSVLLALSTVLWYVSEWLYAHHYTFFMLTLIVSHVLYD